MFFPTAFKNIVQVGLQSALKLIEITKFVDGIMAVNSNCRREAGINFTQQIIGNNIISSLTRTLKTCITLLFCAHLKC